MIKIKEGDWVVCTNDNWDSFTYGKSYQVLSNMSDWCSTIDVADDNGARNRPSYCYYIGSHHPSWGLEKAYYFMPLADWREKKLNELI
jgi:hypothetical protein